MIKSSGRSKLIEVMVWYWVVSSWGAMSVPGGSHGSDANDRHWQPPGYGRLVGSRTISGERWTLSNPGAAWILGILRILGTSWVYIFQVYRGLGILSILKYTCFPPSPCIFVYQYIYTYTFYV